MTATSFLRQPFAGLAFAIALAGIMLMPASASAFQLVPISQDFEPSGRGANQVFQVENDRDEPVNVTISITGRKLNIDGNETMPATEDFSVFPTEVILQPNRAARSG